MEDRQLTKAEEKRLAIFQQISETKLQQGYQEKDMTVPSGKANLIGTLYGFILTIPFIVLFYLLVSRHDLDELLDFTSIGLLIFVVAILLSFLIHELIHGLVWSLFAEKHWKSIDFGILWKTLNPYCTCIEPLKRHAYILGSLAPCLILGIIPSIIALCTGNLLLLFFGFLEILSAGGDLLILSLILKHHPSSDDFVYLDHPTMIGLVCFEK